MPESRIRQGKIKYTINSEKKKRHKFWKMNFAKPCNHLTNLNHIWKSGIENILNQPTCHFNCMLVQTAYENPNQAPAWWCRNNMLAPGTGLFVIWIWARETLDMFIIFLTSPQSKQRAAWKKFTHFPLMPQVLEIDLNPVVKAIPADECSC